MRAFRLISDDTRNPMLVHFHLRRAGEQVPAPATA